MKLTHIALANTEKYLITIYKWGCFRNNRRVIHPQVYIYISEATLFHVGLDSFEPPDYGVIM